MTQSSFGRVLITGGAGFIGSHLVDALLASGAERVVVVDTFFLGSEDNLADAQAKAGDSLVVYREDAADFGAMSEICRTEKPDLVFNLATKALLYSFFNPSGACRVNLDIALTLCELQRAGAFGRLVHSSSSEVYGTARFVPMTEDHPLNAETTYAAGKAAADLAVAAYVRMFDLDAVTVRPFNNYGPRQNEGAFAAVIPLTVKRILEGTQPIIQGDGSQTRDFIYVMDSVDAMLRIAATDVQGETLNVGSGIETSITTIVETIVDHLGWDGGIHHEPARKADVLRLCAGVDNAQNLVGPLATTSLADGLAKTIDWYVEHRPS
ncbi:MAG: GDP-mannose 4,6-dehydratase [Aquihabitans sp.]